MLGLFRLFKGQHLMVLLFAGLCGGIAQGKYRPANIAVKSFGTINSQSVDTIPNATVERVTIYPQGGTLAHIHIERNGVLVRYKDAVATILICHGFMCDKFDTAFLRRLFPRGRFNVMNFDFRAHGEKRHNQYCTLGSDEAYDVIAAAQFLRNHPDLADMPLYVYGFSMGAVAAIEAEAKVEQEAKKTIMSHAIATAIDTQGYIHDVNRHMSASHQRLFDAMLLDCPFDSSDNVIKRGLEHFKITLFGKTFYLPGRHWMQKLAYHPYVQSVLRIILKTVANMDSRDIAMRVFPVNPVQSIAHVSVPVCLIHCKKDNKVSIDGITDIYNNAASQYKTLWITNGRAHYDSFFYNPEKYTEHVRHFLEQALNGNAYKEKRADIFIDEDEALGG